MTQKVLEDRMVVCVKKGREECPDKLCGGRAVKSNGQFCYAYDTRQKRSWEEIQYDLK